MKTEIEDFNLFLSLKRRTSKDIKTQITSQSHQPYSTTLQVYLDKFRLNHQQILLSETLEICYLMQAQLKDSQNNNQEDH